MSIVTDHPTKYAIPHWQIQATGDVAHLVQDEVSRMTTADEVIELGSHPPGGAKNGVRVMSAIAGRPESEITVDQAMNVWVDGVLLAGQSLIDSSPAAGDEAGCREPSEPA